MKRRCYQNRCISQCTITICLLLEIGTTNTKLKSRIPRRAKPSVVNIMTINLPFGFAASLCRNDWNTLLADESRQGK